MTTQELRNLLGSYLRMQHEIVFNFPINSYLWMYQIDGAGMDEIASCATDYFNIYAQSTSDMSLDGDRHSPESFYQKLTTLPQFVDGTKWPPDGIDISWSNGFLIFRGVMTEAQRTTLVSLVDKTIPTTKDYLAAIEVLNSITNNGLRRAFIADLIWLFYYERMGIFKIFGEILDNFATKGKFPIPGVGSEILEDMIRETKMGISSSVRDRDSSYRRCLGWTSDVGRKLSLQTEINTAFNNLFHKFTQNALDYYKDKRLAYAIRGAGAAAPTPSAATLITIRDTIEVLKQAFKPFDYGRNHTNTVLGILWVVISMAYIRNARSVLGIPVNYNQPSQYISAAYDLLCAGKPITTSECNRYILHKQAADNGREILLELEVLEHNDSSPGGALETWLDLAESKIEGYRTAYRSLTGVDLGIPGAKIEQQA